MGARATINDIVLGGISGSILADVGTAGQAPNIAKYVAVQTAKMIGVNAAFGAALSIFEGALTPSLYLSTKNGEGNTYQSPPLQASQSARKSPTTQESWYAPIQQYPLRYLSFVGKGAFAGAQFGANFGGEFEAGGAVLKTASFKLPSVVQTALSSPLISRPLVSAASGTILYGGALATGATQREALVAGGVGAFFPFFLSLASTASIESEINTKPDRSCLISYLFLYI